VSPGGGWEVREVGCSEVAVVTIAATAAQDGVEEETCCWYVCGRRTRTWLHVIKG
jgi:hypothetical protein